MENISVIVEVRYRIMIGHGSCIYCADYVQEYNKGAGTLSQLKIASKLLETQQETETLKRFAEGGVTQRG